MYTSLCRYLHLLPVVHTPILWNKMAAPSMYTVNLVGIFIFVGVNTTCILKNMTHAKGTIEIKHF